MRTTVILSSNSVSESELAPVINTHKALRSAGSMCVAKFSRMDASLLAVAAAVFAGASCVTSTLVFGITGHVV
ncbi:hypothetical protein SERLA73DRAFT_136114 [Serpula lacrymans var. lacrymans S7.3]|uniref:Uncharacterized protein n=2 Tax=Serpula lacrymans var. lacrymans TaxID=341189 RepID=F8PWJ9_SERL3|nr:uncharacterized protein SERLADRAFT_388486 [Serpula lacrymans var. lacrymans S7.9]EGO00323.1 hypothetical protein SERLA73DRAFT_136114 [Serpula lacrymans var. lacrymans S7.3]EGO25882.1 hypothetical protein SERLADRAFT_388486 [Serpula lacrymans var. lacrymans S7.9]